MVSYRTYGDPVEPPRRKVERALAAWSQFPVSQVPRPLVLLGSAVQPGGYPDGQTKLAFARGAVEAVPGFPGAVLDILRARRQPHDGPKVLLTQASLGTAEFVTDRGHRELPAWTVSAQGVTEPIKVLDPGVLESVWRPADDQPGWWSSRAAAHGAGQLVTLEFIGTPYAFADYCGAEVVETDAAVGIIPAATDIGPGGPRAAFAQRRLVSVTLATPLGSRILLDQHGSPVMVQPG
jgi:hypothetical protein